MENRVKEQKNDDHVTGGYDAAPAVDIRLHQVGMDEIWNLFLHLHVQLLQKVVFIEYKDGPPRGDNFVVRYKSDEQPALKPHDDESKYTLNIALNRHGIDYEGGYCRFFRYNCSLIDSKVGWMLLHPGGFTHYHEGLPTTKGPRYLQVTLVDPME